jgi:hypothetical protein
MNIWAGFIKLQYTQFFEVGMKPRNVLTGGMAINFIQKSVSSHLLATVTVPYIHILMMQITASLSRNYRY